MQSTTYSVSSVFAHGDALNSSILTHQRGLWISSLSHAATPYYSGNQTQTCSIEISIMRAETSIGEGSGKAQQIFIFGTRNAHFVAFSGQFEYSCLGCKLRPTPALCNRSVKKDRVSVRQKKDRNGVPVPNEPWFDVVPNCKLNVISTKKRRQGATWNQRLRNVGVPIGNRQVYIQLFILQTIGGAFFASSRQEGDDTR